MNSRVTTYVWGCSTASMVACLMVACMVFICVIVEGERGGAGGGDFGMQVMQPRDGMRYVAIQPAFGLPRRQLLGCPS